MLFFIPQTSHLIMPLVLAALLIASSSAFASDYEDVDGQLAPAYQTNEPVTQESEAVYQDSSYQLDNPSEGHEEESQEQPYSIPEELDSDEIEEVYQDED